MFIIMAGLLSWNAALQWQVSNLTKQVAAQQDIAGARIDKFGKDLVDYFKAIVAQQQQRAPRQAGIFGQGVNSEMNGLNALAPDYTKTPHWPEEKKGGQ